MCKCGCGTCETKITGPLLTESKVKSLLSEGLNHHISNAIPLHETVYRYGSVKHLSLIKEARKLYSRNVIDLNEFDVELVKTHLGEWGLFENESVPLDLPMLEEEKGEWPKKLTSRYYDEYRFELQKVEPTYKGELGRAKYHVIDIESGELKGTPVFTSIESLEAFADDLIKPQGGTQSSNFGESLNESYDYDEVAQSEFGMDYDQLGSGEKEWVRDEIDNMSMSEAYSGFRRGEPEDPDSIPFKPTGSVSEFREDLRALFGKFKGDLKNPDFIKGVAQIMVNWKSLLRSQLDEAKKAKKKKKDPPIGKPKRGGSKAYYVYVRDPKTKKIKKVSFGSGGLRAKINNPKARNAFAKRHRCSTKNDRTKPGYWSCRLPRYAKALGLGNNKNTFW